MIRFLNLKGQISDDGKDFAFYDTVSDNICFFGKNNQEVFESLDEFKEQFNEQVSIYTRPIERFISLIPENYFK